MTRPATTYLVSRQTRLANIKFENPCEHICFHLERVLDVHRKSVFAGFMDALDDMSADLMLDVGL